MSNIKINKLDIVGNEFNLVKVISYYMSKNGKHYYKCQCVCGREIIRERWRITSSTSNRCIHERNKYSEYSKTRIMQVWRDIIKRCYNPNIKNYKNYGARGITVCDEWKNDFMAFYNWAMENGYQNNLTIDRIDVNGNYEPSNCRWITIAEQQKNKTNNHYIIYKNTKYTLSDLSKELNIPYNKLRERLIYCNNDITRCLKLGRFYNTNKYKSVVMLDKTTNQELKKFDYICDAICFLKRQGYYKNPTSSKITDVCKGKRQTAYGYKWMYFEGGDVE